MTFFLPCCMKTTNVPLYLYVSIKRCPQYSPFQVSTEESGAGPQWILGHVDTLQDQMIYIAYTIVLKKT